MVPFIDAVMDNEFDGTMEAKAEPPMIPTLGLEEANPFSRHLSERSQSVLTQVQENLGGVSKTLMIS